MTVTMRNMNLTIIKGNSDMEADDDILSISLTQEEIRSLNEGQFNIAISATNINGEDLSDRLKVIWVKRGNMPKFSGSSGDSGWDLSPLFPYNSQYSPYFLQFRVLHFCMSFSINIFPFCHSHMAHWKLSHINNKHLRYLIQRKIHIQNDIHYLTKIYYSNAEKISVTAGIDLLQNVRSSFSAYNNTLVHGNYNLRIAQLHNISYASTASTRAYFIVSY